MDEDFDAWNFKKKEFLQKERPNFSKGDIWFTAIGKNIGDEEDGKHSNFERPVLIIRKFNNHLFLGVPLTSNNKKEGKYYHKLISFPGSTVILSQLRIYDAKRLLRLIGKVSSEEINVVKAEIGRTI